MASVFDPLGFAAPVILKGKQILQRMCQDKLGWDEPLPSDLRPLWEAWLQDLNDLSSIEISRHYLPLQLMKFSSMSFTIFQMPTFLAMECVLTSDLFQGLEKCTVPLLWGRREFRR